MSTANYTQSSRPMSVKTPLGDDDLLLVGFSGHEAISHLFSFQLELLAKNQTKIAFDKLLGQQITVQLGMADDKPRYFSGICSRFSQGGRDAEFTSYRLEMAPELWLLTHRAQSRIFQHKSVPDILKKALEGLDVAYELQGSFLPRDYCVQYRETDFNFASRLMEEEGIYYFFKHTAGGHKMVVANTPQSHAEMPGKSTIIFDPLDAGHLRKEDRIHDWEKAQELTSGKYTLWDHNFELPHKHLEAEKTIQDSVSVGTVTHKLKLANNDKLEFFDFPGEYAQRFDGIDAGGGDRAADVQNIFQDNKRTVGIRMQEEALSSVVVHAAGGCRQWSSGHKFTLDRHFDANGQYVVTSVQHSAHLPANYRTGSDASFKYQNSFTCIPVALPFRPPRMTPKPVVHGTQTAVVVGHSGDEIFTDKYGRVKVQFHWDREGKNDANSSCWVRVGSIWAGKQWGAVHIPRVGQEVIVAFQEGDPDQPIIMGSVYNADQMPPYALPANKTQSGIKSRSSLGGGDANYNEIRFEDKKGSELVAIHAEKDQLIEVEHDETHTVGHDRKKTIDHDETTHVKHDRTETVDNNETITIHANRTETVDKDEQITIGANRTENVSKNESITIGEGRTETVGKNESITIGESRTESVGQNESITIGESRTESVGKSESISIGQSRSASVGGADSLSVGKTLSIVAADSITLTTGGASITMQKDGTILISGKDITINGSGAITGKAAKNMILKGQKILQN